MYLKYIIITNKMILISIISNFQIVLLVFIYGIIKN